MPWPTMSHVWFWLFTVLCAGAGAYFGAYFKEKAKNLATKEDFADLKEQTIALRQTTKEIETKIDDQVWNRQRQWEMKRDILIQVTKAVANADDSLLTVFSIAQLAVQETTTKWVKHLDDSWVEFGRASTALSEATLLTRMSCVDTTSDAIEAFHSVLRKISLTLKEGDPDINAYTHSTERAEALAKARAAIRSELGFRSR